MLSPEYINLTGNEQLNVTKQRLNKVIYDNIHKYHEMKKELENFSDVTQLENKDANNPFVIESNTKVSALVNGLETEISKMSNNVRLIRSLFHVAPILGRPPGLRMVDYKEITNLKKYFELFMLSDNQIQKTLDEILLNSSFLSKSDNKKIDDYINHINYLREDYDVYFFNYGENPIIYFPAVPYNVRPLDVIQHIADIYNSLDNIKTKLAEISDKAFEHGINPLLVGKGISNNFFQPIQSSLYPDIPSKYK